MALSKGIRCNDGLPSPSINQKAWSLLLGCAKAKVAIGPAGSLKLVNMACVGGVVHKQCLRKFNSNCHCSSAPNLYWGSKTEQLVNQCRLRLKVGF